MLSDIDKKFEDLELLEEEIFKDVKFYISGQAPDRIGTLLKNGGAERMNYFSDYVTHLICGLESEESDLTDATDLYEIPAVSCKWVLMCAKTKSLVHTKPYLQIKRLFSGLNFCLSVMPLALNKGHDRNVLWAIITFHGGTVQLNLDGTCQYLVSVSYNGAKYKRANERMITVVTPDWILDSVKNNTLADIQLFHPTLITWPKPSRTAAITGFQDVEQIERIGINTASYSDDNKHFQLKLEGLQVQTQQKQTIGGIDCDLGVNNSTQALLDKLKSRMPWNQPQQVLSGIDTSDSVSIRLQTLQQLQPITSSSSALYQQHPLQADEQNIRNAITGGIQQQHQNVSTSAPSAVHQQQQSTIAATAGTVAAGAASFNRILEQLQQSQQQRTLPTGHQLAISTTTATCIPQQQPFLQQQFLQQQRLRQPQPAVSIQQQRMAGTPQQQQQHVQLQRQLQLQQQQLRSQGPVGAIPSQHIIQRMQQPQQQRIIQPHTGNLLAQQLEQGSNQQQQQIQYTNQQQQNPLEKQQQHYNMLLQQKQQQLPSPSQSQPQLVNATPSPPYIQQQQQFISQQQTQQPFPQNNNSFNTHQQQFAQQQQQLRMIGLSQQQQQFNQQSVSQPQQRQWPLQQQQIRLPTQQGPPQQQQQQQVHRPWPPQTVTTAQQQTAQIVQQPLAPPAPQPQRQLIHLDAQTHQQLQQMAPEQRALFVAKLQKQRHLMQLQQQRLMQQQQQQQQQRVGQGPPMPVGPGHIVIRSSGAGPSNINHQPPPGLQALQLSPQQQHWVQQQKQQSVQPGLSSLQQQQQQVQQSSSIPVLQAPPPLSTPASLQVNNVVGPPQPLGQQPMAISNIDQQQQQQQLQLRHHYRLQQMQAQREQSFKLQQVADNNVATVINAMDVNSGSTINTTQCISSTAVVPAVSVTTVAPLVVNPKTKTALANMLSNRLHSGNLQQQHQQQLQVPVQSAQGDLATSISSEIGHHVGHQHPHVSHHNQLQVQQVQPSAASTLKLLTANHNAQLHNVAPPPPPPHPLSHGLGHGTHIPSPQHLPNHPAHTQQRRNIVSGVNASSAIVPCQGQVIRAHTGVAMAVSPSSNQTQPGIAVGVAVASQHQLHQQPQHRPGPGPFYGHNPNLKLPSELFLLGCIFVCVEIGTDLDASVGNWRQRIERHGGELELQYCARVTHVLCGTQRHGVVMQALRDYKRCVTAYWLADTLLRRKVEPPSAALHLPAVTLDSPPGTRHLVALSGFAGTDRERIKYMIKLTGAQYTNYFSRHNSVLVAARPDGPKFAHARKWGTPVVSVHWLTDVLLGHCGPALAQLDHAKYQQWMEQTNTTASIATAATKNIFAFDAALVPSLMQAWKMPINISQESYERVKRTSAQQKQPLQIDTSTNNVSLPPPSIRPPKRPRLDVSDQLDTNDYNDTTTMTETAAAAAITMETTIIDINSHRILFSTCTKLHDMRMAVLTLGGVCARSHRDATHLVMSYLSRTNKLLLAVARGLHVVSDRWLRDSLQAGKFLQDVINNYSLDSRDFNVEYKCDLDSSLRTNPIERQRLLAGRTFFLTPSLFPRKQVVAELIQSCGGTVERVRRSAAQIESAHAHQPHSYVIVTHAQDLHLVADLLAKGKGRPGSNVSSVASITVTRGLVCNVELVLSAIMRQVFEVEPYAVKVL